MSDISEISESGRIEFPYQKKVMHGHFKDMSVLITDPDIQINHDNLNYGAVNMDNILTKDQKREKKRRIIEMASKFFNVNRDYYGISKSNKVTMSAVAKFFGIARQSFNDHIKCNHLNIAVYGHTNQPILKNEDITLVRSLVNCIRNNENVMEPFVIGVYASDKELINLIALVVAKRIIQHNLLNEFKKELDNVQNISFSTGIDRDIEKSTILRNIVAFFEDSVSAVIKYKITMLDISNMVDKFMKLEDKFRPEEDKVLKLVSRRTISRSRKRIGIPSQQTKTDSKVPRIPICRAVEYNNDTETDDIDSKTNAQESLLDSEKRILNLFGDMRNIVNEDTDYIIRQIQNYRVVMHDLFDNNLPQTKFTPLLVEQFQLLTAYIVRISFENRVLKNERRKRLHQIEDTLNNYSEINQFESTDNSNSKRPKNSI